MPETPADLDPALAAQWPRRGRSLASWVELVRATGPAPTSERVDWLKRTHGLSHVQALVIAEAAGDGDGDPYTPPETPAQVDALYAPLPARLRLIHDELLHAARYCGPEVTAVVQRGEVQLIRRRPFASIRPDPRGHVVLGLFWPAVAAADLLPTARLAPVAEPRAGEPTHWVVLTTPLDVDQEVTAWLAAAYAHAR